jgi:hypothetical protein
MNRPLSMCAILFMAAVTLGAQDASQSNPYEGTSTPPPDDNIMSASPAQAKPLAGRLATPAPAQQRTQSPSSATDSNYESDGGMPAAEWNAPVQQPAAPVRAQPAPVQTQPTLIERNYPADPDGDIVHPQVLLPGGLPEGTTIHVRLLDRLSTKTSGQGASFRGQVTSEVLLGSQALIPIGAEIDGRVVEVSSGHPGGHGSMLLRPETIILPNGSRYHLYAELTGTRGSKTQVGDEGKVLPASRLKRDGIEYGATVGAGAITGAVVGGPVGALAGSLIGAGVVTAHLLISHPQATLEPGTTLVFTLTQPLNLVPAGASGS